jgi:hypothetical protein
MSDLPIPGISIDPHHGQMHYIVTLNHHDHLDEFYEHMEKETSLNHVPDRICECIDRMPISRNTVYSLEHHEAVALYNDPRVISVSMTPQLRGIEPNLYSWTSSSSTIGVDFNQTAEQIPWGIYRTRTKDDIQMGRPYAANLSTAGTRVVSHELSGKNVDVVIVDGGNFDPQTLEYRSNSDGTGSTRVIEFNWFENDQIVSGGKFKYGSFYSYERYFTFQNVHQAHTAGTTAGNTKGLARDADIYMITYNLSYSYGARYSYSSQLYPFQFIKQWHLKKKINPFTGRKNPTVTNNSWGYNYPLSSSGFYLRFATKIVHRGMDILPSSGDPLLGTAAYSTADLDTAGFIPRSNIPIREPSIDADIIDLAAAGVINVVSAGNSSWYCDVPDGPDYNNYFLMYTTVTITLTGPVTFDGSYQEIHQSNRNDSPPPAILITTSGTTNVIVGTGWINPFFDKVNTLTLYNQGGTDLGPNSVPISVELGGLTAIYYHRGSSPGGVYQGDLSPIVVGAMGATVPGFMRSSSTTSGPAHYGNNPINSSLYYGNYKSEFSNFGPRVDVFAPGAVTTSVYVQDENDGYALKPGDDAYYHSSKTLADPREATLNPNEEDVGNSFAAGSYIGQTWTNQYSRNVHNMIAGTSMAGPHVTGVLACLLEQNPGWTQKDARAWIAQSPELMLTTTGGTRDTTDLGLSRNSNSCNRMLYLPSTRFLDDTPNSIPTQGYQKTPYPLNSKNFRKLKSTSYGQTYPRNNIRSIVPVIPKNATILLTASQTVFTEVPLETRGFYQYMSNSVTFTINTTNVPNGTIIPYSITNRFYRNTKQAPYYGSVTGLAPLFESSLYEYNSRIEDPKKCNLYNDTSIIINNNIATYTLWMVPLYHLGPTYTEYPWTWGFQFRLVAPGNPYVNIKVNTCPYPTT